MLNQDSCSNRRFTKCTLRLRLRPLETWILFMQTSHLGIQDLILPLQGVLSLAKPCTIKMWLQLNLCVPPHPQAKSRRELEVDLAHLAMQRRHWRMIQAWTYWKADLAKSTSLNSHMLRDSKSLSMSRVQTSWWSSRATSKNRKTTLKSNYKWRKIVWEVSSKEEKVILTTFDEIW